MLHFIEDKEYEDYPYDSFIMYNDKDNTATNWGNSFSHITKNPAKPLVDISNNTPILLQDMFDREGVVNPTIYKEESIQDFINNYPELFI